MLHELKMKLKNEITPRHLPCSGNISAKYRDVSLDFLKLISAFLVVFYHLAYYKMDYGIADGGKYIPNVNRLAMSFAACSVPMFFMINGILMFSKHRNPTDVYYKVLKILFLVVIWKPIGFPSWFLVTLSCLYCLFPFFQHLWEKKPKLYKMLICAVLVFPFMYNYLVLLIRIFDIQSVMNYSTRGLAVTGAKTMYSIVYFLGGNYLAHCSKKKPLYASIIVFIGWLCLILECVCYTRINGKVYDGVNASFPTIGALLLAVGLYELVRNIDLNRFQFAISFCSEEVLAIYLLHMTIIRFLSFFTQYTLVGALLVTIFVCLICIVLGKIIRFIPVLCSLIKI